MTRLTKIKKAAEKYESLTEVMARRNIVQDRLKALVHEYGLEEVATAAGYTSNTLQQYMRVKTPPMISESSVIKAEKILTSI